MKLKEKVLKEIKKPVEESKEDLELEWSKHEYEE